MRAGRLGACAAAGETIAFATAWRVYVRRWVCGQVGGSVFFLGMSDGDPRGMESQGSFGGKDVMVEKDLRFCRSQVF